jgi:flagellar protein FlaI
MAKSGLDDFVLKTPKLAKYVTELRKKAGIEKIDEIASLRRFRDVLNRNPHLKKYIERWRAEKGNIPKLCETVSLDMGELEEVNIIYPVGDPIFIHINQIRGGKGEYIVIQPQLSAEEEKIYKTVLETLLLRAAEEPAYETKEEFEKTVSRLLKEIMVIGGESTHIFSKKKSIKVTESQYKNIEYRTKRDLIENGILEPMISDPYLEDIHAIGMNDMHVYHKVFGMLKTNVRFQSSTEIEDYLRRISERIGKPVTDRHPIIDAALPDGSRINIIYSDDVSRGGPSFTIRKFPEKPLTITQLTKWGTFSPEVVAYLWLCVEYGMNICISGETSSGKTTTLNALLTFVRTNAKIYTAEDTPEVVVPHPVWQRLITREMGPAESQVELFDLVKTALRSRPDVIVVGEVRGKEGFAAFQAMQTGHEVLYTFHASSIEKMIQRFTGDPINVPVRFIDNLNVALFQQIIYERGRIKRRCSTVAEVLGYSREKGGVLTRTIFSWDPVLDRHYFRGIYNSYILEEKIAPKLGYDDVRAIYRDLQFRARIIQNMLNDNIVGYDEVNQVFKTYYEEGFEGLSERLKRET